MIFSRIHIYVNRSYWTIIYQIILAVYQIFSASYLCLVSIYFSVIWLASYIICSFFPLFQNDLIMLWKTSRSNNSSAKATTQTSFWWYHSRDSKQFGSRICASKMPKGEQGVELLNLELIFQQHVPKASQYYSKNPCSPMVKAQNVAIFHWWMGRYEQEVEKTKDYK